MISLPPDTIMDGEIENAQALTDALRNLLKSEKIKNKEAVVGISGQSVIIKKISVPLMSEEELAEMIREEAEQYIPFDINEVNLDFQIVRAEGDIPVAKGATPVSEEKQMDVIIVAVRKEVVQSFLNVFKEVGMKVKVVDLAVFALQNIFEFNYEVETDASIALVNIGASMTNVNILEGGVTAFTRDIPIGGATISEEIQKSLSIGFSDAEKMKLGIILKEHSKNEVIPRLREGVQRICEEIRKTFDMFEKTSDFKVSKIYLCGGSCQMEGMDRLVHDFMGIDTEILNSFGKVSVSEKNFDREYLDAMGPVAAIPMGLALRMADDK
jgi:type IV pilus assembly protein PilM